MPIFREPRDDREPIADCRTVRRQIEAAFDRYAERGGDVIIGLGGGSCIDAAKGVAILSGNGGRILGYEGVDTVVHPIPPTVMVPSSSGTGADVSQFAVVTDTAARIKITIISRTLVPEISVIDPRLLTTMPQAWPERFVPLAAAAGIATEGVPATEVALLLAERVRELADEVGVPKRLAALGVSQDMLPQLAWTTLKDACLTTNPREAGVGDIEALFRAAL